MTTDRAAGVVLALFGAWVLWESRALPLGTLRHPGPGYMPVALAVVLVVCALAIVSLGAGAPYVGAAGWGEWRHAVAIFGACAFAALALERLGYRLTVALVLVLLVGVLERRGPVGTLLFAVAIAAGTYFLFDTLLRVPLPRGPLGL